MSKSNRHNNTDSSSSAKCRCGRKITLAEEHAGLGLFNYECPECFHRKYSKSLTNGEFYEPFKNLFK